MSDSRAVGVILLALFNHVGSVACMYYIFSETALLLNRWSILSIASWLLFFAVTCLWYCTCYSSTYWKDFKVYGYSINGTLASCVFMALFQGVWRMFGIRIGLTLFGTIWFIGMLVDNNDEQALTELITDA